MYSLNKDKTQVLVLSTLHKFHKESKAYTYDDIFKIIEDFNPDALGVEIRPEDIKQPREYFKYYPYEMVEALFRWSNRIEVYGVDYYEKSVEGKLIPDGYFDNFFLHELESKFETDPLFAREREAIDICGNKRSEIIDANMTAAELNDGRYDMICDIYYRLMEILLKDTPYEPMVSFYRERDRKIDENIVAIVNRNIGKKLAFLLGADHRVFAVNAIKARFGDDVEVVKLK